MKQCSRCFEVKSKSEFPTGSNSGRLYYYSFCRACYNAQALLKNRRYKENNRAKLAQQQRVYYQENKEHYHSYNSMYYDQNSELIKQQNKIYASRRKREDSEFRLRTQMISSVRIALKGIRKCSAFFNEIGYTVSDLKLHLESQFESWMSWDNWGRYSKNWNDNDASTWTWQIDHIIPLSKFDIKSMQDSQFRLAWDLGNLRPLSAKQNLIDGNRR